MQRRTFVTAALAAGLIPALARAQPTTAPATPSAQTPPLEELPLIEPQNALEHALLAAYANEALRPAFRRALVEQPLALVTQAGTQTPFLRPIQPGRPEQTGYIFTSAARIDQAISAAAPRIVLPGRQVLTLLRGKYAVLNHRLRPFLTIEPDDINGYLAGAGPEQ